MSRPIAQLYVLVVGLLAVAAIHVDKSVIWLETAPLQVLVVHLLVAVAEVMVVDSVEATMSPTTALPLVTNAVAPTTMRATARLKP